ncbi:anaerobic C4-dicarboxylate transporter family protein [Rhizobium rhizosphaerae]|uniref:anaerobic C4-dicarboxylate transporter family protein n=1 Tax=Xaviernesmea rhizosphaerae TaxID=1672749 RepID=UPI0009C15C35|nr:anaerobic C4-dicarboxylate transporter family protein [Xaviernesmea rhizosphaerae]
MTIPPIAIGTFTSPGPSLYGPRCVTPGAKTGEGTENVWCSLPPVIYQPSYSAGVRPGRPLALSATAGQLALTTSPASASMMAMVGLLSPAGFTLGHIILIVLPASIVAILIGAFTMNRIGKELEDDPEFRRRCAQGLILPPPNALGDPAAAATKEGKRSALIFAFGIADIMASGFTGWKPIVVVGGGAMQPLDTTLFIQMVMLATAALIGAVYGVPASDIPKSPLLRLGLSAIVTLFGVA